MVTEELQKKQDHLEAYLKQLGSVVLAFSGGVDSTYLMHEARKVLGDRAMAVTMNLASVPEREVADAIEYCRREGIRQEVVKMDQFGIEGFAENPSNRCYLCKHFLFSSLKKIAEKEGFAYVIDGTNLNDASQYRPGLKALGELGIRSPLRHAGLYKADIRALSKEAGLPTWSKPSFACMATRFPYGETITEDKLSMVEKRKISFSPKASSSSGCGFMKEIWPASKYCLRICGNFSASTRKWCAPSTAWALPMSPWTFRATAWAAWMKCCKGRLRRPGFLRWTGPFEPEGS